MLTEEELVERLSELVTSGARADSPEARQLLKEVVEAMNKMPEDQALVVGVQLAQTLEKTRTTFDRDASNTISDKEILAVAKNDPKELLALLPASAHENTGSIVQASLKNYGSDLANICSNPAELQKTFNTLQPQINEAIGNVKSANTWGISFINRQLDLAAGSVNKLLKEAYPGNAPQLDEQGSANLNAIIAATADSLPNKIKLPSAEATCEVINQHVPRGVMMAAADTAPRR